MTCANCGHPKSPCFAAARAFHKGRNAENGAEWSVCRKCRWKAVKAARDARAAGVEDWTGHA